MDMMYRYLLFAFIVISSTFCEEDSADNAKVENLKTLRKSVNFAYTAGNNFLNLIRGSTPPIKTIQQFHKMFFNNDELRLIDFINLYLPFAGFIVLSLVGLIFGIFLPIVGCCFCLCRCAGNCGGRVTGMDSKRATCKRYTFTLFLSIITIAQLGGICLAFINNQLIHETLTNPSLEINAIKQLSFGNSQLNESLRNVTDAINASERSSEHVADIEIEKTNLSDLTCVEYLSVLRNDTDKLNTNAGLKRISSKLDDTVKYIAGVKGDYGQLLNVSSIFGKEIFNMKIFNIRSQVCRMLENAVGKDLNDLNKLIRLQIKEELGPGSKLKDIVKYLNDPVVKYLDSFINNINIYMKVEYLEYRMYICIGVCCLLLLITVFFFLGLCFGLCGERPFEDAKFCNRGVGANLLMAGVSFAFLFTPTIALLEMYLFNTGMYQTDLCRFATNSFDPGVKAIDSMLQQFQYLTLKDISPNTFDSIINRCPSEPMVVAFNLEDTMTSYVISNKTTEISKKVKSVAEVTIVKIVDDYFHVIERLLVNINEVVASNREKYDGFDSTTKGNILKNFTDISNEIKIMSLSSVKEKYKNSFDVAADAYQTSLTSEVKSLFRRINREKYKNVKCDGIYRSSTTIIDSFCVTFLWPFNGFWFGIGICVFLTVPAIIFAVKLAGLYRRTEKYSSDYEEPDCNYMGFYTNNADNIPMKRPKSAKSNHKSRSPNTNSNKESSLKQNNPQYLPVYPYDAYE